MNQSHRSPIRTKNIGLITCKEYPDFWENERLLMKYSPENIKYGRVFWGDPISTLKQYDYLLIRTTWDYHKHLGDFLAWLELCENSKIKVYNPYLLVKWNSDKAYLKDFIHAGIPLPKTKFINVDYIEKVLPKIDFNKFVIKPTVSAGAENTYLIDEPSSQITSQLLKRIHLSGYQNWLIQEFMPEVRTNGEISLFYFNGKYAYSILKKPKPEDFRVQHTFGGVHTKFEPTPELLMQTRRIFNLLPATPAYARIDGIMRGGAFFLMEVELIEPNLHFTGVESEVHSLTECLLSI